VTHHRPPPQQQREEDKRQMDENEDERELVARLPCGAVQRIAGVEAIGGGAKMIDREQGEALEGERKGRPRDRRMCRRR